MMIRTMILSLLLAGAGCAHRTYVSSTYPATTYYSTDSGYYYEPATSKGAGARALKNDTELYNDSVAYDVVTPDAFAATTQGAGARALTGRPDTSEIVEPGAVAVYGSTGVGGAEVSGGTASGSTGNLAREDANFIREATQMGLAEVRMAELIEQKAQNSSLRSFGDMLTRDHKKANDELQQIAQQKQFTEATSLSISSKDQAMLDKLSSLEGPDFDRAAERDAINAHQKAIKLFNYEAEHGQDSDVRAFAQ